MAKSGSRQGGGPSHARADRAKELEARIREILSPEGVQSEKLRPIQDLLKYLEGIQDGLSYGIAHRIPELEAEARSKGLSYWPNLEGEKWRSHLADRGIPFLASVALSDEVERNLSKYKPFKDAPPTGVQVSEAYRDKSGSAHFIERGPLQYVLTGMKFNQADLKSIWNDITAQVDPHSSSLRLVREWMDSPLIEDDFGNLFDRRNKRCDTLEASALGRLFYEAENGIALVKLRTMVLLSIMAEKLLNPRLRLTDAQQRILNWLAKEQPLKRKEIASKARLNERNLNHRGKKPGVLSELIELGLVARHPRAGYTLTDAGNAHIQDSMKAVT